MDGCDSRKSCLFTSEPFLKRRCDKYSMNDSFPLLCSASLLIKEQFDASSWALLPFPFPCLPPPSSLLSLAPCPSSDPSLILLAGGSHDAWFSMEEKGLQLC